MDDELKCLGYYSPKDGHELHVIDTDPFSITKQLEDLSQVEKYMMSDSDYDQLPNSYRKFVKNLRKNNPEFFSKQPEFNVLDKDHMKEETEALTVINITY